MINKTLLEIIYKEVFQNTRFYSWSSEPLVVGEGLFYRVCTSNFSGYLWLVESKDVPEPLQFLSKKKIRVSHVTGDLKDKSVFLFSGTEGRSIFENLYPEVTDKLLKRNQERFSLPTTMKKKPLSPNQSDIEISDENVKFLIFC